MKISEDVLKSKGIPYVQKYPYGELAKVTKNKSMDNMGKYRWSWRYNRIY